MALTTYTDYATIRSLLGVSEEEIEDSELALNLRYIELVENMLDLSSTLPADYLTVLAIPPNTQTANQARFVNLVQAYSGYAVAYTLLGALPMFAPKKIKDNSAETERVTDPYLSLRADISSSLDYLRKKVLQVYQLVYPAQIAPNPSTRRMVSSVGLGINPVTNA